MTDFNDVTDADSPRLQLAGMSAERIWRMLDSAPDGMLLADGDGAILAVNQQVERLFGYDRDELIGGSVDQLLPERLRHVHRGHRASYHAVPQVRSMGERLELRARRRDGSEFPVEVSLSPLTDAGGFAVVASIRDVSERIAVERRLALSEETFRTSFENAPVGMIVARLDDGGRPILERVNRAFAELLGQPVGTLLGVDSNEIVHREHRQECVDVALEMAAGTRDALIAEIRYLRADGTAVWALVHSRVIDRLDGALTLSHVVDLTDRRARQVEAERMAMMEDRERIARDLHDLVIQRLFGAGMKLNVSIPSMGSVAASTTAHEIIDELDETIRELRSAIFSLNGGDTSRPISGDVTSAVDQSIGLLGFRPRLDIVGPLDAIAHATATELVATLREALSNVARHAAATEVQLSVAVTSSTVTLTVRDDGCGLDADRPSGHGLANMQQRASKLGGTFTITSPPNGGTELMLTIPR